ncbi:hypothetical protein [Streptomyces sp. NPDC048419]|uniref:hypothetical protein n=1 Tax=Streptomyces sp. NPDC048419 TaxID=3365547 RepID=UPI003715B391
MNKWTTTDLYALALLGLTVSLFTYSNPELAAAVSSGLDSITIVLALIALLAG